VKHRHASIDQQLLSAQRLRKMSGKYTTVKKGLLSHSLKTTNKRSKKLRKERLALA